MKPAFSLLLFTGMLFASQTLSIDHQQALKTYNHKPSQISVIEKRMKQFAKITRSEAVKIAKPVCPDEPLSTTLNHQNAYLFYTVKGQHCEVYVNALDGTILQREDLNE